MKRYPNGAAGEFFFMKARAVAAATMDRRCVRSRTARETLLTFPIIQDLPALLWVINLGFIDLNQWYARCDDVDRPDYLHFESRFRCPARSLSR